MSDSIALLTILEDNCSILLEARWLCVLVLFRVAHLVEWAVKLIKEWLRGDCDSKSIFLTFVSLLLSNAFEAQKEETVVTTVQ